VLQVIFQDAEETPEAVKRRSPKIEEIIFAGCWCLDMSRSISRGSIAMFDGLYRSAE
jgi:hypothetical protein